MIINYDTLQTAKLDADAIPFKNALPTEKENGEVAYCAQNFGTNFGLSGNVINLRQDLRKLCTILPLIPNTIATCIFEILLQNEFNDFKVRGLDLQKYNKL